MANLIKGILGGFSGKVGTVIGMRLAGKDCIRSLATPSRRASSAKQTLQRDKFQLMAQFLNTMSDVLLVGFPRTEEMNSQAIAMSYNLKNAVTLVDGAPVVDFAKVSISSGKLAGALNPGISSDEPNKVLISWTNNSGTGKAQETDQAHIVVHCPEKNQTVYAHDAVRGDSSLSFDLPEFAGLRVHAYITFINEESGRIAASVYAGRVEVNATL